jgi:hypothetical protein
MALVTGLVETKSIPEIVEIPITGGRARLMIEELEDYNSDSRQWKAYTTRTGDEIPQKYRGRNRYWVQPGEGVDSSIGNYPTLSVYDLDPEAEEGKVLIARYRITDTEGNTLQTLPQIEKHVKAARLDAERKERAARADPRLQESLKVHLPTFYRPETGRKKLDESLTQS